MENTNTKPRTIEEFFIEQYQKLEEENKKLKIELEGKEKTLESIKEIYKQQIEKLSIFVEKIKKDLNPVIRTATINDELIIDFKNNFIWKISEKEKYEYYKEMFNLKEEGEEDNEQ